MASVRQRGQGRWQVRVWVGTDPLTAKPVYKSRTIQAANKREAERVATAWEHEIRSGDTTGDGGTMGDLFDAWLQHRGRRWSPATARSNRAKVDTYLLRPLGHVPVERVTTRQLDTLYRELAERGGRCQNATPCDDSPCEHGAPLAASTVVRLHALVSGALAQAVAWGWIARNPAEHADPGSPDAEEIEPPAPADVVRLLAAAEDLDPALALFIALAAETGARRGALHALRWSDWTPGDMTSTLRMRRVLSIGPAGPVERPATKGKRTPKRVTIGPHVTAAMAGHHDRMFARALAAGAALPEDAHMFSWDVLGERPWHPDSTTHRFARIRDELGLAGLRLHDMRHLMATSLLSAGVAPQVVGSRGGWRRLATMLDTYAHVLPADDEAAAGVVDRFYGTPREDR